MMTVSYFTEDDRCNLVGQGASSGGRRTSEDRIVGTSQAAKAASHDRILDIAAAQIRRDGVDSLSVAELMKEAGLTHGGFYRHFDSREVLVAEAAQRALSQGSARAIAAADLGGRRGYTAVVNGYLSAQHRDHPESGCAVATSAEDIARVGGAARTAYSQQVREYLTVLERLIDKQGSPAGRREAVLTLSVLVGALSMARAIDDPALSEQILADAAAALIELVAD
jgi:TetR/AcrR family transcriptional repressor of nem operon